MLHAILPHFYGVLLLFGLASGRYEAPFECAQGLTLNDNNRMAALDLINQVRSSVALGTFKAKNFLSSATNMNKLAWNCTLEGIAQDLVNNCHPYSHPLQPIVGSNYHFFEQSSLAFDRKFPIQAAILLWSEISNETWPPNNVYDENPALFYFSNMIRAKTLSAGCSSATCTDGSAAACVFSAIDVHFGEQVYSSGTPCQDELHCNTFSPTSCENGLCITNMSSNATALPTTAATRRRRSTDCLSKAFSSTYRDVVLGMHNNFRSLVARGLAKNGEYPILNAPSASRMDLMEYDCIAEFFALNHVTLCDKQPSSPFARLGYSENIHILPTTATDLLGAIQNAIASFTSELETNGIPSNMVLTPEVFQRTQKAVTSVSKVLWASNRYVACATRLCSGFYFTSCMYKDPVNVIGQSIYPIGLVCSSCPTGPNNCNPAIGLCSY